MIAVMSDLNPRTDPPLDFPDGGFGSLSREDYDTLGFMSGLEVHQQLFTTSKLFCRCPTGRFPRHHDVEVLRHMRPTLSELGEYDGTALMEFKTHKEIVYQLERASVCTYEIDDTPPFEIDEEAVRIAIEVSELLGLNLVSELHVMRKQYLDGSIPTGFQRTAMVGLDGSVPFREPALGVDRVLRIRQLSLEEDSCREVSDVGHRITFATGRLGMPLVETVTEPELMTPLEVEAGGRLLAEIVRATGKVRRGLGAARQDVNVSVAGGRRVEIKGVHRHKGLPLLVHVEAFRQLNLLRIREELRRRGVTQADLSLPAVGCPWEVSPLVADVTGLAVRGPLGPARSAAEEGDTVCAVRVPGFARLLSHRTQPGRTFAHEFSERVRVIACPERSPFLSYRDGSAGIGAEAEGDAPWQDVRKALGSDSDDAVVLVWVPRADAETAAREVLLRAQAALEGVPAETRQANRDGTTGFERILPGADRMYPDTDTPPLPIPPETVSAIRANLPEHPVRREERYVGLGLAPVQARRLARSPWAKPFDEVLSQDGGRVGLRPQGWDAALIGRLAWFMVHRMPHHGRGAPTSPAPEPSRMRAAVDAVAAGEVRAEALPRMLDAAVNDTHRTPTEIVASFSASPQDGSLGAILDEVALRARDREGLTPEASLRWAMGEAMRTLLGRADPSEVRSLLAGALGSQDGGDPVEEGRS